MKHQTDYAAAPVAASAFLYSGQAMDAPHVEEEINRELLRLQRAQIARPLDLCLQAQLVTLNDSGVRQLLQKKLTEGHIFIGATCTEAPGIPEFRRVLFRFEKAPGAFCLTEPSFMIVVNLVEECVVSTLDPYVNSKDSVPSAKTSESSAIQGGAQILAVKIVGEILEAEVRVHASIQVGWPICDSTSFDHTQTVHLKIGEEASLVQTDSGRAKASYLESGELSVEVTIEKWGVAKEWQRTASL